MQRIFTYHITNTEHGMRTGNFLSQHGYSRHIRTYLKQHPGSVILNGEPALFYFPLQAGDDNLVTVIHFFLPFSCTF